MVNNDHSFTYLLGYVMAPDATKALGEVDGAKARSKGSDATPGVSDPIGGWFKKRFGKATAAQTQAWPALLRGENLLLAAPTGSGKTLAAFLPIFRQLFEQHDETLTCLYIAPLKALSRDAGKNIRRHLRELRETREPLSEKNFPHIRVGLRSGDTTARWRRRHLDRPPHILLTTPESLAILLSQPRWCDVFRNLRCVVVDEIHAMIGNKRGADLALGLERLDALVRERTPGRTLQRIGLSATCAPLELAAQFLVGVDRSCAIAQVSENASMELLVEPLPVESGQGGQPLGFMARLVDRLATEIGRNRTTLIFANIRGLAERLTWALRHRFPAWFNEIGVHHSSLDAERRRLTERLLKKGKLRVIVSSTSLEFGIDIGSVDGVVFVHPPGGVARTLQRLGRSGHQPGRPRRGLLLTAGAAELLEATVTAASVRAGQIESVRVVEQPLDILCQHLVGMSMTGWRDRDDIRELIRQALPFCDLNDRDFDRCLAYLSGKRDDGSDWLPTRLRWHAGQFAIVDEKCGRLLRRNFGSIMDEEPRPVRLVLPPLPGAEKPATVAVGTLEDSYADRLRPGDRFVLDGRCFQFRREVDRAFLVDEAQGYPSVPVWTTGGWHISRELARRVYLFRMRAAEALREGGQTLTQLLKHEFNLEDAARAELSRFFMTQEMVSEIPGQDCLLIESVPNESGIGYFFHTPLARAGNDALARVLAWRLHRNHGWQGALVVADLGFMLEVPADEPPSPADWRSWLTVERFDEDLSAAVRDCASLRDRFARVAMTGLMVLRNPWGGRRKVGGHDWVQRRLFDQVRSAEPDFVLLRQAEQEILREVCDAAAARQLLDALPQMHVRCRPLNQVSPFAEAWTQPAAVADEPIEEPVDALARLHAHLQKPAPAPLHSTRRTGSLACR